MNDEIYNFLDNKWSRESMISSKYGMLSVLAWSPILCPKLLPRDMGLTQRHYWDSVTG